MRYKGWKCLYIELIGVHVIENRTDNGVRDINNPTAGLNHKRLGYDIVDFLAQYIVAGAIPEAV
jgi:hypothetical protein